MRKFGAASLLLTLAFVMATGSTAFAQSSAAPSTSTSTIEKPNLRFFQQFATDAAIVEKQWYGIEFRWLNGAVPPHENADGFMLTPTVAVSPLKNLEVGGTVSYIDYDLDSDIIRPGTSDRFSGNSGLGDLTTWGKYRFLEGPVSVSAGALLDLPTGSEEEGLGTGKVTPGLFGAFRAKAGDGAFLGDVALRFNRDARILKSKLNGKTSTFIGGGYIWEAYENWVFSGEVTVESERFDGGSSDFRATAGAQFLGVSHSFLRGAVSVGLTDGAPDFEIIMGYAYVF